jgi:hypothetical protein
MVNNQLGLPELKMFEGFIHLNYKSGKMEMLSRKQDSRNPYVIVVPVKIEVEIPVANKVVITGKVTVPEVKLKEAMIHEL